VEDETWSIPTLASTKTIGQFWKRKNAERHGLSFKDQGNEMFTANFQSSDRDK
jgi:hypothetical protein